MVRGRLEELAVLPGGGDRLTVGNREEGDDLSLELIYEIRYEVD